MTAYLLIFINLCDIVAPYIKRLFTYTCLLTAWRCGCSSGQPIDSASNGRAPLPWEIHCHPTQMFHDETHLIEVPHTAAIAVRPSLTF